MKQENYVKMVRSLNGNQVVEVCVDGSKYTSTPTIAKMVSDITLIFRVIELVRANYPEDFKENAIEDLYPRVRGLVNKIFNGYVGLLNVLNENAEFVVANSSLFYRAMKEVTFNEKRSAPSRAKHPWIQEKIDPRVLKILEIWSDRHLSLKKHMRAVWFRAALIGISKFFWLYLRKHLKNVF